LAVPPASAGILNSSPLFACNSIADSAKWGGSSRSTNQGADMANWNPRVNELFLKAVELPDSDARNAFLAVECGDEVDVRRAVETLLNAHDQAGGFLNEPHVPAIDPFGATTDLPGKGEQIGALLVGRYKLIEAIGEGGMGSVYMAQQTTPIKRAVAVKVIKAGMDSKAVLARFEAERQALAMMDHPNIAKVLDAGSTESGRPFFVMELVKGVPITQYCDEKKLTPRQRLELFVPVCSALQHALQHAHQKGIIHRDIKPNNVLVAMYDDRPVPKVIDFGVAKATGQQLTDQTLHTGFGAVVGTVEYMSPEQASFNQLDVDTRSDIYSLGVMLYELLAGSPPFSKKDLEKAGMFEMLRVIREEEPSKPSTKLSTAAGLPALAANRGTEPNRLTKLMRGELDWIVMKALEKDRSRRYETANGFAMDVQRYLADEAVQACPPSASYRLRKFLRRNKRPASMAGLLLAALVTGMIGTTVGMVRARAAEKLASQEANNARTEAAIAQEINDFLNADVLGLASGRGQVASGVEADPDLKVRTALDRAARRIGTRFHGQPRVEAAIRRTMGMSYRSLGLYPQALEHLGAAADLLAAEGEGHADLWTVRHDLGVLYRMRGEYNRSEQLLTQVLDARRGILGPDHPDTLITWDQLAVCLQYEGKFAQAEEAFLAVLDAFRRTRGEDDPLTLTTANNLTVLWNHQGKNDKAVDLMIRIVAAERPLRSAEDPALLSSMNNLGAFYFEQGKYSEAEQILTKVVNLQRRVQGPEHPDTLTAMNNLGDTFRELNKLAEAEKLFVEILEVRRRVQGEGHQHTTTAMNNLGLTYLRQRKYQRAEEILTKALENRRRFQGVEHPLTLTAMANLALAYLYLDKYDLADPLLIRVIELRRRDLGVGHRDTIQAMVNLTGSYFDQKKYPDAEKLLLDCYERRTALTADRLQWVLEKLVQLYDRWGKKDEAAAWRNKLEAANAAVKPPVKP
jgi:eukaryotic-like serine/threonine-protein kinase